jgi:PAS domain S-box-containing protein
VEQLLGIGLSVLAVATTLYKGGTWALRRRTALKTAEAHKLDVLNMVKDAVDRVGPLLQDIQSELKTNGGGSLRDAIHAIQDDLAVERAARRVSTAIPAFELALHRTGEFQVTYVSPAYVQLTGLTREDTEDAGWLRAVAPEDRDRVSQLSAAAMHDHYVMTTTYVVQHVHSGRRVAVEHTGYPIFSLRDQCVGWYGVLRPFQPVE